MIAKDFRQFLESLEGFPPTHYQHASGDTLDRFAWFIFSGSQTSAETLAPGPPDQLFADLEIYSNDLDDLSETIDTLMSVSDHRGEFGAGQIEDVAIEDQRDDYTPLADAESLPKFSVFFRVTLTGYTP